MGSIYRSHQTSKSTKKLGSIDAFTKHDDHYFITYTSGEHAKLYILNNHVFRFYMSPNGEFLDYPIPNNPSDISHITNKDIKDYGPKAFEDSNLLNTVQYSAIETEKIKILFDKENATMTVVDKRSDKEVLTELTSLTYAEDETVQTLKQTKEEFFFGGGMQNGRFSHKGHEIAIVNTNNWLDGGVASPCPFYWSTKGYGVLRNTWKRGFYDFGSEIKEQVTTVHLTDQFDAFFFINETATAILKDYYELTGQPIFMPEYAFYESHLNAFNRDYWVKEEKGTYGAILFEDGFYYKCYQPSQMGDRVGVLESLNGEKDNYQFSARAMIDRYKKYDIPLGWFVPNDGYGSGYGQTESLDGDLQNLKEFGDYARTHGVEVALWTESNLEPVDPEHPKKGERDLRREAIEAGVVALKADVAWIGAGYSFGLSAIENAANIFIDATKQEVRPMVIMVDGWAGTQRCSGIWSGDQSGGDWEYIRFHIPTYTGTGLSGQPVIGSDMDGIYRGGNKDVNIRDYQWKTFTPLQLNMDGWGSMQKTPFAFDEEATRINRAYLKLKSMFMPYNYTVSHESINGKPMVRAMFLEFNEGPAYTIDSQYQFMWGPSILVAPVYNGDVDENGDSIRNGIYLPKDEVWVDYVTGEKYQGGRILNDEKVPIWKLPVYIKEGAILPMTNANNNPYEIKRDYRIFAIYPKGKNTFDSYEDDGISMDYLKGKFATTKVSVIAPESNETGDLIVTVDATKGSYRKMVTERSLELQIKASSDVDRIKVAINGEGIEVTKAVTREEFDKSVDKFYVDKEFLTNPYLDFVDDKALRQTFLLIKLRKVDVTMSTIQIKVPNFENKGVIFGFNTEEIDDLETPQLNEGDVTSTSVTLKWDPIENAEFYDVERDGYVFSRIKKANTTFEYFNPETKHEFRIRSVSSKGVSKWSDILQVTTKEDPRKHVVKDVKVTCNIPAEPGQDLAHLVDGDLKTLWHTEWSQNGKYDPISHKYMKISFDLGEAYDIERMEYLPRNDAGNGTFKNITYKVSNNNEDWSEEVELEWELDHLSKVIELNSKFRYMEITVKDSVGLYGAGRDVSFYTVRV